MKWTLLLYCCFCCLAGHGSGKELPSETKRREENQRGFRGQRHIFKKEMQNMDSDVREARSKSSSTTAVQPNKSKPMDHRNMWKTMSMRAKKGMRSSKDKGKGAMKMTMKTAMKTKSKKSKKPSSAKFGFLLTGNPTADFTVTACTATTVEARGTLVDSVLPGDLLIYLGDDEICSADCDPLIRMILSVEENAGLSGYILTTRFATVEEVFPEELYDESVADIEIELVYECPHSSPSHRQRYTTRGLQGPFPLFPDTCDSWQQQKSDGGCTYTDCFVGQAGNPVDCFECTTLCNNGCGSNDGISGQTVFDFFDFSEPCCIHDVCYSSTFPKPECDENFRNDMLAECPVVPLDQQLARQMFPDSAETIVEDAANLCRLWTALYYGLVRSGGSIPWLEAQQNQLRYSRSAVCGGDCSDFNKDNPNVATGGILGLGECDTCVQEVYDPFNGCKEFLIGPAIEACDENDECVRSMLESLRTLGVLTDYQSARIELCALEGVMPGPCGFIEDFRQRLCSAQTDTSRFDICVLLKLDKIEDFLGEEADTYLSLIENIETYLPEVEKAKQFWESIITDDIPDTLTDTHLGNDTPVDDLIIYLDFKSLKDGQLALATVQTSRQDSLLPSYATLTINEKNFCFTCSIPFPGAQDHIRVLKHEMAHNLGVGCTNTWCRWGALVDEDTFNGPNAVNEWQKISRCCGGPPVETTGGASTAGFHWAENCMADELMTGLKERVGQEPLSAVTLGALQDLCYQVDFSKADAFGYGDLTQAANCRCFSDVPLCESTQPTTPPYCTGGDLTDAEPVLYVMGSRVINDSDNPGLHIYNSDLSMVEFIGEYVLNPYSTGTMCYSPQDNHLYFLARTEDHEYTLSKMPVTSTNSLFFVATVQTGALYTFTASIACRQDGEFYTYGANYLTGASEFIAIDRLSGDLKPSIAVPISLSGTLASTFASLTELLAFEYSAGGPGLFKADIETGEFIGPLGIPFLNIEALSRASWKPGTSELYVPSFDPVGGTVAIKVFDVADPRDIVQKGSITTEFTAIASMAWASPPSPLTD
jgi:hypothetical protein